MASHFPQKIIAPIAFIFFIAYNFSPFHAIPAVAADCINSACIDVYTQDGQIIIVGKKAGSSSTPKPVASAIAKPAPAKAKPVIKPKPKVIVKPKPSPAAVVAHRSIPRKPVVHKKITAPVSNSASLNDRLVKMLPVATIAKEPSSNAIVNMPMIYWCDLPALFTSTVSIVGEIVDVTMRPSFLWSFGDGGFLATTQAGAAFPHEVITHTYNHAGTFIVTMLATWGGTWTHNGVARAITGEIRKVSITTVHVANGPTRITQ